jgi:hypothetical protein
VTKPKALRRLLNRAFESFFFRGIPSVVSISPFLLFFDATFIGLLGISLYKKVAHRGNPYVLFGLVGII